MEICRRKTNDHHENPDKIHCWTDMLGVGTKQIPVYVKNSILRYSKQWQLKFWKRLWQGFSTVQQHNCLCWRTVEWLQIKLLYGKKDGNLISLNFCILTRAMRHRVLIEWLFFGGRLPVFMLIGHVLFSWAKYSWCASGKERNVGEWSVRWLYGLFVRTLISITNTYAACGRCTLNFIERFWLGSVRAASKLSAKCTQMNYEMNYITAEMLSNVLQTARVHWRVPALFII